jgi:cellulose synthase/poly-beta-1,6-N-acetylglucosamine synthase-like glycosyltransferase
MEKERKNKMKEESVSIVIPIYKPDKKTLEEIFNALKKQKFDGKVEVIKVDKKRGLAESLNWGIKKSKYPIIVSLHQDCIPSDENWLRKLVEPFKDKEVILTVSKVKMPEELWNNFSLFTKALMIKEKGVISPSFDEKGCGYRKEVLIKVGLFNEKNFLTGGEDADMDIKLAGKGKIIYPECTVIHKHPTTFKTRMNKIKLTANSFGTLIRMYGLKTQGSILALIYSIPFLGALLLLLSFPFKKNILLYPFYILSVPLIHYKQITGFWEGFIKNKQTIRSY